VVTTQRVVRRLIPTDVDAVAELHELSFPGHFMTSLGSSVLRSWYLEYTRNEGDAYGVVALDGEKIVGVAVGVVGSGFETRFFRGHWHRLAVAISMRFVSSAQMRARIWERSRYMKRAFAALLRMRSKTAPARELPPPSGPTSSTASLMSIAVHPSCRGQGIAEQLQGALLDILRATGVGAIRLYVLDDNARAIAFYQKAGWQERSRVDGKILFMRNI
jgi:ribosomal protein S18 acetylase RimI-like enzyme